MLVILSMFYIKMANDYELLIEYSYI